MKRTPLTLIGLATCLMSCWAADGASEFKSALAAKVDQAEKQSATVVTGLDGWLFLTSELRHLSVGPFWGESAAKVSRASNPAAADPLPAILDFKAQLDKAGIQLVMVPVPAKAAIYPDMIVPGASNSGSNRLDSADADFIGLLKGKGISVVDLAPSFLAYRASHPDELLYSRQDTHWSGAGIQIACIEISKLLNDQKWIQSVAKSTYKSIPTSISANGDLATMTAGPKPAAETLKLNKVTDSSGAVVSSARQSPLVLLGDSHNLIYSIGDDMLATGCGLPENLAAKIGFVPDVVAVRGSGATPARVNLARRGDSLAGKKAVVWCFTVREFTEGQGWRRVPVIRQGN